MPATFSSVAVCSSLLCGLLLLLLLPSSVLADEVVIVPVGNYSSVIPPDAPEGREECVPGMSGPGQQPFSTQRVLVLMHHGAEAYDALGAWKYFTDRGAAVDIACVDPINGNMLLEIYYPWFRVTCSSVSYYTASNYGVLFVPGGYSSTLALRTDSASMSFINRFITSTRLGNSVLIVAGGAAETMIESNVLPLFPAKPQIPVTTQPVFDALAQVANASAAQRRINASLDLSVFNVKRDGNESSPVTTNRFVAVAESSLFLNELLIEVSRQVFTFYGDAAPVNCSTNGKPFPSSFAGTPFTRITDTTFPSLRHGTNRHAEMVNVSLEHSCRNEQGTDFCIGRKVSLVLAHGSHDVEVMSAVRAFQEAEMDVQVFCPDDRELHGILYLMPFPSTTPTYSIKCTRYYNSSLLAVQSLVIIPSGPIATHRRLRGYQKLLEVMQYTGTYALFGTAMALLTTQDLQEHLKYVPHCPFTDNDLANGGFVVNRTNPDPKFVRNHDLGRSKVIAGFSGDEITLHFAAYLNMTVRTLVWENDTRGNRDALFGGVFMGLAALAVLAVVIVMCLRRTGDAAKQSDYTVISDLPQTRDYQTTP